MVTRRERAVVSVRAKVLLAETRLKRFEPADGYWLAFSGGKDSQAVYHLALSVGVRFEAHFNLTTADPPELVRFIRERYPEVVMDRPAESMWRLIARKRMPPTRLVRYCCSHLKERGGSGRVVLTGVRWAESSNRRRRRGLIELNAYTKQTIVMNNDSGGVLMLYRETPIASKHVVNPIVDWNTEEVWAYLDSIGVQRCSLYDEGLKRLGCIGCPQGDSRQMRWEFERWPKYRAAYIRAFEAMLEGRRRDGLPTQWETGEEVMSWWLRE